MLKVFLFFTLFCTQVLAATLEGVNLPDSVEVLSKKLILNGTGLRTVMKFGFNIKVYVAGLYLENKTKDNSVLVLNGETKQVRMQFLRAVDRESLIEAFQAGIEGACVASCESVKQQFAKIKPSIVNVRKDNVITLTYQKDSMTIETDGPNAKKSTIDDANLSKNMLSLFIHEKQNPGAKFRQGLLGL